MLSNFRVTKRQVSFNYGKRRYTDKIKVSNFVPEVGHYKRRTNVILIDRKLPEEYRKPVSVHEATERFERYHLHKPVWQAHKDALRIERRYDRVHGISWNGESRAVDTVFRENWRKGRWRHK
jgi:hypothetical protein